uniref:Uncharacterized protein n=1 Tax=Anopheles coluzzii TaxID=1518534 RepID=A0A8W7PQ00_ANOCL
MQIRRRTLRSGASFAIISSMKLFGLSTSEQSRNSCSQPSTSRKACDEITSCTSSAIVVCVASDCSFDLMCGKLSTNFFSSWIDFSPWFSFARDRIDLAMRERTAPTALKFLSRSSAYSCSFEFSELRGEHAHQVGRPIEYDHLVDDTLLAVHHMPVLLGQRFRHLPDALRVAADAVHLRNASVQFLQRDKRTRRLVETARVTLENNKYRLKQ